jgi:phosphoribosyl 1,2-cyclic phosphodiesterase
MPAKIIFLGTAGGRFVVLNQLRASGGWILEMDGEMLHIDPGPGALVRAKQYGVRLGKLTGVIVSHTHPDHCTDAQVVIEAMTRGAKEKRGILIGSESVIKGSGEFIQAVSPYHLKAVERVEAMKPGDRVKAGKIEIEATKTKHREPSCIGFVFRGSSVVGYTSDGEYFSGQDGYFRGCDCLIVNCLRPRADKWPEHMNAGDAEKLIGKAEPRLAILQHIGMLMLKGVAEREAGLIQKNTGVRTIAARDGMVLDLNGKGGEEKSGGLDKFLK